MNSLRTIGKGSRTVRGFNLAGLCWMLTCAAAAGLLFAAAAPDERAPSSTGPGRYTTKSIEDVRAGQRVWAYDVGSGRWAPREVVRPLTHDYEGDVVTVAAAGERIEATGNHPFWVVAGDGLGGRPPAEHVPAAEQDEAWRSGKGRWVDARHLQRGDLLLLRSGELATVEELASRRQKLKVYNLEVADLHTYAVSHAGVVVHNRAMANTETVQRWMSQAELEATRNTGLLRGGRQGTHYVTDAANSDPLRARQRLALPQTPEVRVTMEVPPGTLSPPTRVPGANGMPGGGMERTATGDVPVRITSVD